MQPHETLHGYADIPPNEADVSVMAATAPEFAALVAQAEGLRAALAALEARLVVAAATHGVKGIHRLAEATGVPARVVRRVLREGA